ncbi:unnamed protein product [Absidia cylindrospora]
MVEAGRRQCAENSTKELKDGRLKLPKTIKDMLYMPAKEKPGTTDDLITTGFTIMGNKISMSLMNGPAGYVARIIRTRPLFFPSDAREFGTSMVKLLKLAWTGKAIMEGTLNTYTTYAAPTDDIEFDIPSSSQQQQLQQQQEACHLHPSFYRSFSSTLNTSTPSSSKRLRTL